jgi:hypothetical protein
MNETPASLPVGVERANEAVRTIRAPVTPAEDYLTREEIPR